MKRQNIIKIVVALATVVSIGFGINVLADDNQGAGSMGKGKSYNASQEKGYGPGGYCSRYASSLSEEDLGKAKAERSAFFEATRELRQQAYQKDLELRAELAKQSPDAQRAAEIQKEISDLRAEMDQRHLEHRLRMKAINPELGMGYGRQGCRGAGKVKGQGRCWGE